MDNLFIMNLYRHLHCVELVGAELPDTDVFPPAVDAATNAGFCC